MGLQQPSSTITASALTGLACAFLWQTADIFWLQPRGMVINPGYIVSSSTFASALVGYLKRENVYRWSKSD